MAIGSAWQTEFHVTAEMPALWRSVAGESWGRQRIELGARSPACRPVYVPALDDTGVDALVGPSRGFGWAQAGPNRLEADVPSRAGRDIGLTGFVWLLPLKRGAFTRYSLGSPYAARTVK